tara:strand:+ start:94 stop:522 length:429 start_codon:yes stop_codon:yes gene_type:complete
MAITSAVCNSFKVEALTGTHNFTASSGDTFKLALFTSSAVLSKSTTVFNSSGESSGTNYSSGGSTITSVTPVLSGDTAVCDFANVTFVNVSITARGCLIYNSSKSNKAVAVIDFGSDQSASSSNFVVSFPTANATSAIVRIL